MKEVRPNLFKGIKRTYKPPSKWISLITVNLHLIGFPVTALLRHCFHSIKQIICSKNVAITTQFCIQIQKQAKLLSSIFKQSSNLKIQKSPSESKTTARHSEIP